VLAAAAAAFGVAAVVEFGQLVGILGMLGIERSAVARTLLGTGFDPHDFIAYAVGALAAVAVEFFRDRAVRSRAAPRRGEGGR
jgi:hypothetical protein